MFLPTPPADTLKSDALKLLPFNCQRGKGRKKVRWGSEGGSQSTCERKTSKEERSGMACRAR